MAKKSYAVMNLAYRDKTREDDYNLERVQGKPKYNVPASIENRQFMYASQLTEMICLNTLNELEDETNMNNQYTRQEIDNKLQDLQLDVERHASDVFAINDPTSINSEIYPANEERLTFKFTFTESN